MSSTRRDPRSRAARRRRCRSARRSSVATIAAGGSSRPGPRGAVRPGELRLARLQPGDDGHLARRGARERDRAASCCVADRQPAAVDDEHRAVVEPQRHEHLEAGLAAVARPVAHEQLLVDEVVARAAAPGVHSSSASPGVRAPAAASSTRDGRRVVVRVDALDLGDRLGAARPLPPGQQPAGDREHDRRARGSRPSDAHPVTAANSARSRSCGIRAVGRARRRPRSPTTGKPRARQVVGEAVAVLVAGEPDLHPVGGVDAGVAPVDAPAAASACSPAAEQRMPAVSPKPITRRAPSGSRARRHDARRAAATARRAGLRARCSR